MILRSRFVDVVRSERGMALVMAIGVTMVLAMVGSSMVLFSTQNETAATRSRADVRAFQLAQTGIENAVSQLANTSGFNGDTWHRTRADLFTGSTSPLYGNTSQSFGTGESVTWTGTLYDDSPVGTSGTSPVRRYRWTLSATAAVPNPSNPSVSLSRTLSADVVMTPQPWTSSIGTQAWKYVYSKLNGAGTTCDVTIRNNPDFNMSFYVNGTLCLSNNGHIYGPTGGGETVNVIVKEGIYTENPGASVGSSALPVTRIETGSQKCRSHSSAGAHGTTSWGVAGSCSNHHIFASAIYDISASPSSETVIAPPTTDFGNAALIASPGPQNACETSSGTVPSFTATSTLTLDSATSSFTCATGSGEFSYDATAQTLTVEGLVYLAGNLNIEALVIDYEGIGALYVNGWVDIEQTNLCATVVSSNCDWNNWDTDEDVLLIASSTATNTSDAGDNWVPSCVASDGSWSSMRLQTSTHFQGALYAHGSTNVCVQNNSDVQGPIVANTEVLDNSTLYHPMPLGGVIRVPFGMPGQAPTNTVYDYLPPKNFQG